MAYKGHLASPLTHWVAWGRHSLQFSFLHCKMEKYTYFIELSLSRVKWSDKYELSLHRIDKGRFPSGYKNNKMVECSLYLSIFPLLSLPFIWFHWHCISPSTFQIGNNCLLISRRCHFYVEMSITSAILCSSSHLGLLYSPSNHMLSAPPCLTLAGPHQGHSPHFPLPRWVCFPFIYPFTKGE